MSDPRICIIGAGNLSSRRIYPYIGAAGGQLAGVCDMDADKAARNARRFGGKSYSDMDAMLAAEKPDGVIVCVGPRQHADLSRRVLARGIPVYTEKPPALTAADALETARLARKAGVLCTTAFKKRYAACYDRAKKFIAEFSPAELLSVGIDYASGGYGNETPAGSFLLDFAIHIIDLVGYLFGDAESVFAFTRDHHAYAVAIRFVNGAVGSLNLNDGRAFHIPTEEVEITARGGNALTVHNSSAWRIIRSGQCSEWREPPTFTSAGDSGNDTGHLAEIADFFRALSDKAPTRSDIYESYKSMVLYEAIRASAETGKVVPVVYAAL
jgi:predicted dehydrogenase